MSAPLVGLVVALGTGHLVAYYGGQRTAAGVVKALPIVLLAWAVWSAGGASTARYRELVVAGLVLSALGDVSLVFPSGFLAGLSSFFLAHLCYIAAFAAEVHGGTSAALVAAGIAVFAVGMLAYLFSHVGSRLRGPVVAYVTALTIMVWCAVVRALAPAAPSRAVAAAVGSGFFLVSDGVLAVNRFARPFPAAHAVVMVTYYAAQLLIATSALV